MNYPLISEYIDSIMSAEDNFDKLNYLRPVLDTDGLPIMSSGNFAVVFKMKDVQSGKYYAIKCFLKEQEGREESYRLIEEELEKITSPYLISIHYITKELFVDTNQTSETEFPVLQMDWIEGDTLDKYLRENLDNSYNLEMLVYRFIIMTQWLITQPFAHGDLKPDNILICDNGELVLVDYDGMYVPKMKGQKARELGSPDFRHPLRTENDFDEHIDNFSLASISLSLKAIALRPELLKQYGTTEGLLFSEKDYLDISNSYVFCAMQRLLKDNDFALLYASFLLILQCNISAEFYYLLLSNRLKLLPFKQHILKEVHFHTQLSLKKLVGVIGADEDCAFREKQLTDITDKDLSEAWTDEYGVKYSNDKKRLLSADACKCKEYIIQEGVEVICDWAFNYSNLSKIILPTSITHIGNFAFARCKIEEINITEKVEYIGRNPFLHCCAYVGEYGEGNLIGTKITNLSPHFEVIDSILYTKGKKKIISCCDISIQNNGDIVLPDEVEEVGFAAFVGSNISSVVLGKSISHIDKYAFSWSELRNVLFTNNIGRIDKDAFSDTKIKSVYFRDKDILFYKSNLFKLDFNLFVPLNDICLNTAKWYFSLDYTWKSIIQMHVKISNEGNILKNAYYHPHHWIGEDKEGDENIYSIYKWEFKRDFIYDKDFSDWNSIIKLRHLDLYDMNLTSLCPISFLTQLKSLRADSNQIVDIKPIMNLLSLERLDLSSNKINDIQPLSSLLSLSFLDISNNQIETIDAIKDINTLVFLNLSWNKLSDISPLKNMLELSQLLLGNNCIEDINIIQNLEHLIELNIRKNKIKSIEPLINNRNLKYLGLEDLILPMDEIERFKKNHSSYYIVWGNKGNKLDTNINYNTSDDVLPY